jgi:hypothetical protein
VIFAHHAGKREAEAGRLHDVDDQRDDEHRHQHPVRAPSGASSGGATTISWLAASCARCPRQQAVGGDGDAADDRRHPDDHVQPIGMP